MRSISEAMNFGIAMGMDPKKLVEVLQTCTSNCWSLTTMNPVPNVNPKSPASRNYDHGYSCE